MSDEIVWINGRLCPAAEAGISALDQGLLVGAGVFETLVARDGVAFAAREHWVRLSQGCGVMGLKPMRWEDFEAALAAVMKANRVTEARLRVTQTYGDVPLATAPEGQGTVLVTMAPLPQLPAVERVMVSPWTRNERGALAGVKTTSYGENLRALMQAKALGYGEALLANTRGDLCEGTGSNVFVVVEGVLRTPPLESGCLAGVVRALVLRACAEKGIRCEKEALHIGLLHECDEAFLTSSTRWIHPVGDIQGRVLAAPGPVTLAVQDAFRSIYGGLM